MDTIVESKEVPLVVEKEVLSPISTTLTESVVVEIDATNSVVSTQLPNTVTNIEVYNVVVETESTTTVVAGIQGPPGIPGQSEEDMPYAKQVDFTSDTTLYKGEAEVGSATSAASWRIRKIVLGLDGDVSETWADGNANFDNIWDNRLSLVYS